MNERYSFFEDPDFLTKQEELKKLTGTLSDTKNIFKEKKPFEDPYNFDVGLFEKNQNDKPLGIGKDPNYVNPLTASNDADIMKGIDCMGLIKTSEEVVATETDSLLKRIGQSKEVQGLKNSFNSMLGEKGNNVVGSTVAFGTSALTSATTTAQNEGESIMKGLDLTMKGAQAGMAIGGPLGAGIGAGAGLIYGVIDGFGDANKRGREERRRKQKEFETQRTRREQEQRMKDGKDSLEKLTALRKAQLGYMI